MNLYTITIRSYPSPSITDLAARNRLHTPEPLWRYYIAFICIFYRVLIWISLHIYCYLVHRWIALPQMCFRVLLYRLTEEDHISFWERKKERKRKTLMVQSVLILFALGPQSKEELSIAVAVANESAGKIESGGPGCHPLGDGFKTRHWYFIN